MSLKTILNRLLQIGSQKIAINKCSKCWSCRRLKITTLLQSLNSSLLLDLDTFGILQSRIRLLEVCLRSAAFGVGIGSGLVCRLNVFGQFAVFAFQTTFRLFGLGALSFDVFNFVLRR